VSIHLALLKTHNIYQNKQGQAVRWVRNMEAGKGIKVVSITAADMMRQVRDWSLDWMRDSPAN
jgi:hypothetical protein